MNANENSDARNEKPLNDSSVEETSSIGGDYVEAVEDLPGAGERLQKLIARAGIASRRAAEELITAGQVSVNGHIIRELGAKADPVRDRIVVNGKPLVFSDRPFTVVLLHKPRGCVTTKSDPEKRATVYDLLPKKYKALHTVGRLDFDTAGVLLLTDDGELTHLLTHPSHGIEKTYSARVRGEVKPETLKKVAAGVWISGGDGEERDVKTLPCHIKLKAQTDSNALLEISLREGRNRQIRKMMEAVGHPVSALRRISFAGVELEGLSSGAHRVLLPGEVHELKKRAARQLEKARKQKGQDSGSVSTPRKPAGKRTASRSAKPAARTGAAHSGAAAVSRTGPSPQKNKPRGASKSLGERIRREWK